MDFERRFDYGLTTPRTDLTSDSLGVVYGGADALVIQCDLGLRQTSHSGCSAKGILHAGEEVAGIVTHAVPTNCVRATSPLPRFENGWAGPAGSGRTGRVAAPARAVTGSRWFAAPSFSRR